VPGRNFDQEFFFLSVKMSNYDGSCDKMSIELRKYNKSNQQRKTKEDKENKENRQKKIKKMMS